MKTFICIVCPNGCRLEVDEATLAVTGNGCPRGIVYGRSECVQPMRSVTSTLQVCGGTKPVVSVKTCPAIPKQRIYDVMAELRRTCVAAPVAIGDILIHNVLGLDADIVATCVVEKK